MAAACVLLVGAAGAEAAIMAPHVPLSVKLTKKPAAWIHVTTVTFAWTHKGTAKATTCRLDLAKVHTCSAGHVTYARMKTGKHTFTLKMTGSPNRTITYHFLIDRTLPTAPTLVTGGSAVWSSAASVAVTASGSSDTGGSGLRGYQSRVSTNGGTTWSAGTLGNPRTVTSEGQIIVQFRAVDKAGNVSAWAPSTAGTDNEVWLDRTPPTDPTLTGGSTTWKNVASETLSVSGSTDTGGSGFAGYRYETSTDAGVTWAAAQTGGSLLVSSEGQTLVRFRAVDNIGHWSDWETGTVRIDRTAPTNPVLTGGTSGWTALASRTVSAASSTDSGGSLLSGYRYETSTNNGATWSSATTGGSMTVTAQGTTLVQFQAFDHTGNASGWVQASVQLDRTAPTDPAVSGVLSGWRSVASETLTASGSTDTGGSGLTGYQYQTSTDGGTSWTSLTAGSQVTIAIEGQTLVRFRSIDGAGTPSAWITSTIRIDRTAPTAPTVTGGSASWRNDASVTVAAGGSTDTGGSALTGYQFEKSTDNGTTWSATASATSVAVSAEGTTLVRFQAVDGAGNTSAWVQANVSLDHTPPTMPVLNGNVFIWQSVASQTVTASSSTDAGGSGLAGYQYETSTDQGGTWSAPITGSSDTVASEGKTNLRFRAVDGAGNLSGWAGGATMIDRSSPTSPPVSGGSTTWKNIASETVTAGASTDAVSSVAAYNYETSTDGGTTWSAANNGNSLTVSAEGETLVRFSAIDEAINRSAWSVGTVRIDRTDPSAPTVSGGVASWQHVASLTLTPSGSTDTGGSGLTGYQYETSTNGGSTWSAPVTGGSDTVTAEGTTLARFQAVDGAGNTSGWTTGTAMIDRTNPTDPSVSGGSSAWRTSLSVTVTASGSTDSPGSGVASYQYETSTDSGAHWTSPTSGTSVAVSAEGETLVQFRSVDVSGLASNWVQAIVRLDRTAPTNPVLAGGSSGWQSVAQVVVTASGSTDTGGSLLTGYQYQTSTNGGSSWSAATAGSSATVTAQGTTLVRFQALDGADNSSGWVQASAMIDRTAPTAPAVAGGSASWQHGASVTVTGSGSTDSGGSALAGYQYRTSTNGGSSWSSPTAGSSVAVTAEGTTLVQFQSVDGAGNTSAWTPSSATAGSTVKLDRTAPTDPTVGGGSLSWQSVPSIPLTASGSTDSVSGVTGYEYETSTNSGSTWSPATSGAAKTVTTEGETLVRFRADDGSGLTSNWVVGTARIDRTAPAAPTLTGGSSSWQSAASVTVNASATDTGGSGVASYQHETSTDGGTTWSAPAAGLSVTISAEGQTLVQVQAIDGAGNTSAWSQTPVKIDRTAPTNPTVANGSNSWQNVASVTVTASGSTDSGGSLLTGYQHETSTDNGTTWSAAAAGASVTVSAEGQTLVRFEAIDGAANTSAWVQATVRIDRSPPTAPALGGVPAGWSNAASVTATAGGSTDAGSGVAGYEYQTSTDGGTTWSSLTSGASDSISAVGQTVIRFQAIDNVGNLSTWTQGTVKLDRTAPVAPTVGGGSTTWSTAASMTITATNGSDTGGSGFLGYQYETSTNNGATWSAPASGSSLKVTAEGQTLVQFQSLDNAANASAWVQATVRLDRTAPTVPTLSGLPVTTWTNAASVTVTAAGSTDASSGVARYQYQTSTNGGSTWSTLTTGTSVTVNAVGQTMVRFQAVDNVNLLSTWAPATISIDRTVPAVPTSVTGGSTSWQKVASVTVSATGATDTGGSGLAGYQYRTSTNNGSSWSAASATAATGSAAMTAEGTTLVEFRSIDNAGNTSAWAPTTNGAGNTVKLDRTAPSKPTVSGGRGLTRCSTSRTISASGSTDSGSGGVHYMYRVSSNQGVSWGTATAGTSVTLTTAGKYEVQFEALDALGNTSVWAPTTAASSSEACIN